ncbi:exonuclease SbcCD subunit D [Camelliibacillus cellulosilyticus]|uniref:Exonuclease SbcCD subunit D n=1 Tax=Camelliibacillus cellulosilyticus TaxID=2174486 RepID=A0ABV9GMC9_9BACL
MGVTFIHAADVHLDRPFNGMGEFPESMRHRIRESTFSAFEKLIRTAIERRVDFLILAGDVFDGADRGLRAETRFRRQMKRLAEAKIDVFMATGNHDPLEGYWSGMDYGDNVHIFSSQPETLQFRRADKPIVNIHGFSYPTRHISEPIIRQYEKVFDEDYHIGVLHGSLIGNSEHDVYAPFSVQDLIDKGYDYWALGHIHKRAVLKEAPPIIYPGSLQGLSIKETGEKGFYIVTLDNGETNYEFIRAADVEWALASIDIEDIGSIQAFLEEGERIKARVRKKDVGVLLRIKLIGQSVLHKMMADEETLEEIKEAWRDEEANRRDFVWVTAISDETKPVFDRQALKTAPHFLGDLVRFVDEKNSIKPYLEPLYRHAQAKKFLDPLSSEDERDIVRQAEKLLIESLYIGER